MQVTKQETQGMVSQVAHVPFVDIAATRKGRSVLRCGLSSSKSIRAFQGIYYAKGGAAVQGKASCRSLARYAVDHGRSDPSMPFARPRAAAILSTHRSSGSSLSGAVGPVSGISSNTGGNFAAQAQTNQNTEQHRCDAV
ncbi:hypothetical protein [Roseicyclus sp.]|uniref:hypothetical protein n=1 Tax=Roseicyclus sp. TaxID=1914329 RepID=UPI003F6D11DC